jgi:hypothetical protein
VKVRDLRSGEVVVEVVLGEKLISYYPAFLKLEGKKCVVIGRGKVA